jgi:hypothetical protein
MSRRERELRERALTNPNNNHHDLRTNFKYSLFTLFLLTAGEEGKNTQVFGLNNKNANGINVLILVSSLRYDISNHTVVVDVAVWPLTLALIGPIGKFISSIGADGIAAINVYDDELKLWKEILPAFVERSRYWEHKPSCEYQMENRFPLSLQGGGELFCSCGSGQFTKNFMPGIAQGKHNSKYMTRAAISPSLFVPFVEKYFYITGIIESFKPSPTTAPSGTHHFQHVQRSRRVHQQTAPVR